MDLGLAGRTAYVTGGANGLGAAIAAELADEGVRVVVADIDPGTDPAAEIVADLATREGAEGAALLAVELLGGAPDILVNNVGVAFQRAFRETTDDDWRRIFEANFFSHVRTSRVLLPRMADSGSGVVVNMASDLAKQPEATASIYAAAKSALLSLTKSLALEFAPAVRVNAVCPGPILTGLWTDPGGVLDALADVYGVGREEALERYVGERKIPLGVGEPRDVSGLVAYLVSPRAKHITGCAYDVNGGSVRALL
jgi:NAD(P)-dependent dehydrogenase (short-subunit alcohol dehydrogenase family)